MKETGILFTPDNIRAIREGRKTQTRRIVKLPSWGTDDPRDVEYSEDSVQMICANTGCMGDILCPYGVPGDRLYIKEGVIVTAPAWTAITGKPDGTLLGYYMDGRRVENAWEKRLTAMFMAKRYARTWLEITDVRVERIQDISEEDAIAEGIQRQALPDLKGNHFHWGDKTKDRCKTAVEAYRGLWDSINKKHPFSSNPWVWAITFSKL